MKKKIILRMLLLIPFFLHSYSCKKEIRWEEQINSKGFIWAGTPTNLQKEPFEYFYIRRTEYVKEKVLEKRNGELIKNTCIQQSIANTKSILLETMISVSVPKANPDTPFRFIQEKNLYRELDFDYKDKTPELLRCNPATYSPDKIPGGEYEICECVLYFYHKGGRKDIEKRFDMIWRLMDENNWRE